MTQRKYIRLWLILALFFIALGGWLLHIKVHPPFEESVHLIPFLSGIISIIAIPALFYMDSTTPYAYVINGMIVIIGAIMMSHLSIANLPEQINLKKLILGTTLPDIIILFTRFAAGQALFEIYRMQNPDTQRIKNKRFFRYPNMGWWGVHTVALTTVYLLGHFIRR